ncbi:NYN domain-containing protein [Tenacibaculum piscium]|uniref:NYN domain-containing protein n=2 Tax=Tenacibaculum piscium TaxID=1458515 RepID=UPI001F2F9C1F|nr:NYN domain-containing protein [Tenacibaculum piscium]
MENKKMNIAMLIDGDNAQAKYLENIISETSKYGKISIKRIYGDWSNVHLKNWKDVLNTFSIKPIQEFSHTTGKNATDIALVIDAMDILHQQKIDAFCIVSSDSDFTGLASRIRESGLTVIGIGKEQTPKSFVNACDIFTFTESFKEDPSIDKLMEISAKKAAKKLEKSITLTVKKNNVKSNVKVSSKANLKEKLKEKSRKKSKKNKKSKKTIKIDINFLRWAFSMIEQENGVVLLSQFVESVRKLDANFDSKIYGYKNFNVMFKALKNDFEMIYHNDNSTISIRDKKVKTLQKYKNAS